MAPIKLLLADNDREFLYTWKEHLELAGYAVTPAHTPEEARRVLQSADVDLAVLDVSLRNDRDENDLSGVQLAIEEARALPKIILTRHDNVEIVRALMQPRLDGLPSAVGFVLKEEGVDCLVQAIERALVAARDKMKKVNAAVSWTDQTLENDYLNARQQALRNFTVSTTLAVAGAVIIIVSVGLAYARLIETNWVAPVGGLILEMVALLGFRRVDVANARQDRYHEERLSNQRFLTLLRMCDMIEDKARQEESLAQILMKAKDEWLRATRSPSDR